MKAMSSPAASRTSANVRPTAREDILDAAERVFALRGFDGTSMREVAEAAEVAQALIHYHFGTKDALFEEMFARRSGVINTMRLQRLEALERTSEPLTLDALLDALVRPTVEAGHTAARVGHYFVRLILSLGSSPEDKHKAMIATCYDPMARRFVGALRKAAPGLGEADAVWAYLFVIGMTLSLMTPTGRAGRLSDGAADDEDTETLLARIIAFSSAGIRAFAGSSEAQIDKEN